MAAIGHLYPTLLDIVKRLEPDGAVAPIVETLSKKNPILQDIAWQEGNLPTGHRYTSRTALPSLTWRRFNQGIDPSKSTTDQFDETCGMLEGLSKVDTALARLNGNEAAFRASEDNAFVQQYGIEIATGLFYHSVKANPERFNGLTPRLNQTSGNPAASQIFRADTGASGADQTSIWLVGWSPDTVFGIFPKGSVGGLQSEDLGKQLVRDANGKEFVAWVTHWKWDVGLVVRDWRYVVRICNIDTSAWKADVSAGADLVSSMVDAHEALFDKTSVQPIFYMNRACFAMFNKQLMKKEANLLQWIERGGQPVPHFLGTPIRVVDAITSSESVVS